MLSKLLFLIFISPQVFADASWVCHSSGLSVVFQDREEAIAADYCYQPSTGQLKSKTCYDGDCVAMKKGKDVGQSLSPDQRKSVFSGQTGTPGFRLCRDLGGKFEIVHVKDPRVDLITNRCVFSQDGSFVDAGFILTNFTRSLRH